MKSSREIKESALRNTSGLIFSPVNSVNPSQECALLHYRAPCAGMSLSPGDSSDQQWQTKPELTLLLMREVMGVQGEALSSSGR